MSDEQYAVIVTKPNHQASLEFSTLIRNVPRNMAEDAIMRMRKATSNANIGKIEIIPQARWDELRARGVVR